MLKAKIGGKAFRALEESREEGTRTLNLSGLKQYLSNHYQRTTNVSKTGIKLENKETLVFYEALKFNTVLTKLDLQGVCVCFS